MKVETQSYPSSKTPNSIQCMSQTYFPSPVLLTNLFKSFVQIASRGCAVCLKTVLSDLPEVWFFDSGSSVNDSIMKMCLHWFPALLYIPPRFDLGILAKSLKTSTTTTATPWQFIPLARLGEWIHPLFSWHLNTSKRAKRSAHLTVQCFNQLGVLMVMIFSKAESLKWHCYTKMTTGELAGGFCCGQLYNSILRWTMMGDCLTHHWFATSLMLWYAPKMILNKLKILGTCGTVGTAKNR